MDIHYLPSLGVWWNLLEGNNISAESVFSKYNITLSDLQNTKSRVSMKVVSNIVSDISKLIDSPCFAIHAHKYFHPGHVGILGYSWMCGGNLRSILERVKKYFIIVSSSIKIESEETESEVTIKIIFDKKYQSTARSDMLLSVFIYSVRSKFQQEINPLRVTMHHTKPKCHQEYSDFFKCEIEYNSEFDSFTLSKESLDKPLSGCDVNMQQMNDQILVQYTQELNPEYFENEIKLLIIRKLPSEKITCELIAKYLSMSPRNLQRKLKSFDTTFKTLFDETRYSLAREYLYSGHMNIPDITYLLGFSEVSSFSRAYKRWSGQRPETVLKNTIHESS